MSIYTKKGDKGRTFLGGRKVSKASCNIDALGAVDELQAFMGFSVFYLKSKKTKRLVIELQKKLYLCLAEMSGFKKKAITKEDVNFIEKQIDEIEKKVPIPKDFILIQGSQPAVLMHVLRVLARKAERKVWASRLKNPSFYAFFNRLSDLFYMLALLENKKAKRREKKAKNIF